MKKSKSELMEDMYPILNSGMGSIIGGQFFFAHDRVQESAYNHLLNEKEAELIHYKIGKRWLKQLRENESNQDVNEKLNQRKMFDVVDQMVNF